VAGVDLEPADNGYTAGLGKRVFASAPPANGPSHRAREGGGAMVHLELTPEEAETLGMVLDSYLSDLRMEIADTDRMEFRDMLKARKEVLVKVLDALGQGRPAS
jgi:hypothetical protein